MPPQARPELTRVTIDAGDTQNLTSSDRDWDKLTLESTSRTSLAQPSLRRNRLTRTPKARPELTRHTDRRQHRPRLNIRHHVVEICVVCAWIRRRVLRGLAYGVRVKRERQGHSIMRRPRGAVRNAHRSNGDTIRSAESIQRACHCPPPYDHAPEPPDPQNATC